VPVRKPVVGVSGACKFLEVSLALAYFLVGIYICTFLTFLEKYGT
jgi:hypothetical protein